MLFSSPCWPVVSVGCAKMVPDSCSARCVMIRASCHTADNALVLEFDATPWFREADPQSLLHLAEQDWSSVWIADALETRPGYEGLHQLVEYAATRLRDESLEDPTWDALDCVVNQSDAMHWLAENRPEIAATDPGPRQATMIRRSQQPYAPLRQNSERDMQDLSPVWKGSRACPLSS